MPNPEPPPHIEPVDEQFADTLERFFAKLGRRIEAGDCVLLRAATGNEYAEAAKLHAEISGMRDGWRAMNTALSQSPYTAYLQRPLPTGFYREEK